jgi:uncharacterized protein
MHHRASAAPLDPSERIVTLDILRGLALFFMILVHFHQTMRIETGGLEDLIGWVVWVGIEQKAWGTFAFMFGVGFAVLLRRLEARDVAPGPVYLRRLAALALFGIAAQIFFGFTILFMYATTGVWLLVVRRWSTRALLVTAVVASCLMPVYTEARALYALWTGGKFAMSADAAHLMQLWRAAAEATKHSDYLAAVAARWTHFATAMQTGWWKAFIPDSNLTLFILGLLAVRHRVFEEPKRHVRLIAGSMTFGALSWAASWLLLRRVPDLGNPQATWPLQFGLGLVQDQWLCLTYIGALVLLLAYRPQWTARLAIFAQAGRMAFTNYFVQVIVINMLASGYGVGIKVRPLLYLPATLALFGAEVMFSRAWLARFRFGPLEWIWRMATYARWQPLRLHADATRASLVMREVS